MAIARPLQQGFAQNTIAAHGRPECRERLAPKLASIGCFVGDDPPSVPPSFALTTNDEEGEELARLEHASWNIGRQPDGWRTGPVCDDTRRIHDCIVPYEDLSERIKEYDRAQIDVIKEAMGKSKQAQTWRDLRDQRL